jgi:hypothetical protein
LPARGFVRVKAAHSTNGRAAQKGGSSAYFGLQAS